MTLVSNTIELSCLMSFRDSSFWQYNAYAYIHRGSLERRHQTTVGLRVTRTCCGRIVKFIRYMCNKLAVSSDVGFWGNSCRSLRRRKLSLLQHCPGRVYSDRQQRARSAVCVINIRYTHHGWPAAIHNFFARGLHRRIAVARLPLRQLGFLGTCS